MSARNEQIIAAYAAGTLMREIAAAHGISHQRVSKIVEVEIGRGRVERRPRDNSHYRAAIKRAHEKIQILARAGLLQHDIQRNQTAEELLEAGLTYSQVGKRLGVTRNTIAGIAHRARRRHAPEARA